MTDRPAPSPTGSLDAMHAKYQSEREKRMVEGRTEIQDVRNDERFASYRADPFTEFTPREHVSRDVDVAIVGAGMAGLVVGARLREAGIANLCLIDEAGGVGGTWYWNRYPGVMCDIESYIYMPMLEELDCVPRDRYASGEEIREHFEAIAAKYDLIDGSLFHTRVDRNEWNERLGRWVIRTDRGDEIRARTVIMAVGILNLMKLPRLPGMDQFRGHSFHTARWDYAYTGGSPTDWKNLHGLADKRVAVIGTGATAIQCVPPLAESAEHLYVFQRTPSAVGVRDNRPTDPAFARSLEPGWQRERMDNFSALMLARPIERDLVDDGWTHHFGKLLTPNVDFSMPPDEIKRSIEAIDYEIMESHRARVSEIVRDAETAEKLRPYYHYLCKRPCFHDEYLPTFNRSNVELIDCPSGVERITERGPVFDGREYEVDCIIYATGFEAEATPMRRKAGHPIFGRDGIELGEKWKQGARTLHGLMTRGFPNLFFMPAPFQQSVVSVSHTHVTVEGADHIAQTIALLEEQGVDVFDVSSEAEAAWTQRIADSFVDGSEFTASCTPSRLNFEGGTTRPDPSAGSFGGTPGDLFGYRELLAEWRAQGDFEGLELERRPTSR